MSGPAKRDKRSHGKVANQPIKQIDKPSLATKCPRRRLVDLQLPAKLKNDRPEGLTLQPFSYLGTDVLLAALLVTVTK